MYYIYSAFPVLNDQRNFAECALYSDVVLSPHRCLCFFTYTAIRPTGKALRFLEFVPKLQKEVALWGLIFCTLASFSPDFPWDTSDGK